MSGICGKYKVNVDNSPYFFYYPHPRVEFSTGFAQYGMF